MMVSPFPAPELAPHNAYSPYTRRKTGSSSSFAVETPRNTSSTSLSASRKRPRNESPTRDWQDLGASYDSLSSVGGPSPGFFNSSASPAVNISGGTSESFFAPSMTSSSFASPGLISPSFTSPSPLTQSRYRLAGGQATPTLTHSVASDSSFHSTGQLGESTSDLGFRRGRPYHDEKNRSVSAFSAPQSSEERLPTALSRESNGQPRALPSADSPGDSGLGLSVLQAVSSMVGRVWNFCKAGSFRGFFAGGGLGYSMDMSNTDVRPDPASITKSIWQDLNSSAHLPGGFPDTDLISDYMDSPSTHTSKKAKRAHFEDESPMSNIGSLTQSWIMVRDTSSGVTPRKTPQANASNASPASMRQTPNRPGLRRSSAATTVQLSRSSPVTRMASAAGLRSPTRSPLHTRQNSQSSGSKGRTKREGVASAVDDGEEVKKAESPLAVETARFIKDMKRQERREDRDIFRMNRALEEMIREGQEALGATVEVKMLGEGREEDLW